MTSLRKFPQAMESINAQLMRHGCPCLSQSQFYRLRAILVEYQRSRRLRPCRVLYTETEIRILYLLSRFQVILNNFRQTSEAFGMLMAQINQRGKFGDRFPTFSSIDSFFESHTFNAILTV
jgi:hypothetical protein